MIGSRTLAASAAAMIGSIWLGAVAWAAPVQLGRLEFETATAGLQVVVDTLGTLDEGIYPTAIPIANGIYSAAGPWVYGTGGGTRVLTDGVDPGSPRTFSGFPPGTRYWAADLGVDADAVLRVTAIGANATVAFDAPAADLAGFLAVGDRSGLVAVSVVTVGDVATLGNLAFGNIATATGERARADAGSGQTAASPNEAAPAPEAPADEQLAAEPAEPPTKVVVPAGDYVQQRAVATLVSSREAPEATGSIEARSDGTRVSLSIATGGMTEQTYELRVNGVKVVDLAPAASGTSTLTLTTDVPTAPVERPLDFDPFASRYEIVRDGAVILQTTLGGVAVGGELTAIR